MSVTRSSRAMLKMSSVFLAFRSKSGYTKRRTGERKRPLVGEAGPNVRLEERQPLEILLLRLHIKVSLRGSELGG